MTRSERAMQVWQILVGAAHNRQTLTYGQVAENLEFEGAGVLAQILGCIMNYCNAKGLPPLTCLIVNQTTGFRVQVLRLSQTYQLTGRQSTIKTGLFCILCKSQISSNMSNLTLNRDDRSRPLSTF
jgi:hypothetical protein